MKRMTKHECRIQKQTKNRDSLNRYNVTLDIRSNDSRFNDLTWLKAIRHFRQLLLVLILVLALGGCVGRRITKANVDEVAEGMSKKQVESILGAPTEFDNKDFVILKKTTYTYKQGNDTVTIVFKDDKVVEKQSTLTH
jgi:SmpA / OmlA family